MCFPLETYSIATKLAALLDLKEFRIEGSRKHTGGYPEAKIMALLVVACKLGYELEKTPAWENWAIASEEEEQKDEGDAFNDVGEEDILGMSDEKLDEYMDWVQTGWIDDDPYPGMNLVKVITNFCRKETDSRTNPSNVPIGPAKGVYCT
jgi:hypothetical protein